MGPPADESTWRKLPAIFALAAALLFAVLLGVRPLSSPDIGYHLSYGLEFLRTGKLVDSNDYIYLGSESARAHAEPGPGCWYDADGRYRFPNANWLTQVVMAGLYQVGGFGALNALQVLLTAGAFAAAVVAMRRLGLGRRTIAIGVMLIAMASYERLVLRPEMFSFLLLAVQLAILGRKGDFPRFRRGEKLNVPFSDAAAPLLGWRTIVAVLVVQLLMANLHSYFLLALAPTGALLADALLRILWAKGGKRPVPLLPATQAKRLAVLLGLQAAVCFINPWTWRNVLLPFQTLRFLREHNVGQEMSAMGHPWQMIGEFWKPLGGAFDGTRVTYCHYALLCLAGAGILAAVLRRKWAYAFLTGAMALVSLSMRRNIAPASIVLTPVAMASIADFLRPLAPRLAAARWRVVRVGAPLGIVALCLAGIFSVVTQRFYFSERTQARFGWGISKTQIPTGAAQFVRDNLPGVRRIWTDFHSCSNVRFLLGCEVPLLTNTWAYPPDALGAYQRMSLDPTGLAQELERRRIDTAAVRVDDGLAMRGDDRTGKRLSEKSVARELANAWTPVYFDGMYAVFVNPRGRYADVAAGLALPRNPPGLTEQLAARIEAMDSVPASGWHAAGVSLHILGWNEAAIDAFQRALRFDDRYFRTWDWLGSSLGNRAMALSAATQPDFLGAKADLKRAIECFENALDRCDNPASRPGIERHLARAKTDIQAIQAGIITPRPR